MMFDASMQSVLYGVRLLEDVIRDYGVFNRIKSIRYHLLVAYISLYAKY